MARRFSHLFVALAIAFVGVLLPSAALAEKESAAQQMPKTSARVAMRPVTPYTTAGVLKVLPTPPKMPASVTRDVEKGEVNPDDRMPKPRRPYRGPAIGAATALPGAAPGADAAAPVAGPGTNVGGGAAIRSNARETAGSDFTAFRVSGVANVTTSLTGNGTIGWISDATVANDRNAILYTANWFTAYSADNGMTWGYFDPTTLPTVGSKKTFCCDQYAVSIPRDGYNNLVWVLQYKESTTNNGYRVVVLKDRSGVESLDGDLAYCSYEIWSDRIGLPTNYMLDYPAMQATSKYLYLTANAGEIGADKVTRSIVWRTPISGLDNCSGGTALGIATGRTSLRPVSGAGSTMYFGTQPDSIDWGSKFDIGTIADSSSTVTFKRKNISNWPTGTPTCVVSASPSEDPCGRMSAGKVVSGYRSSTRVGFMFATGTGGSSTDFPYTRVVRFDPSTLALTGETDIWNPDFAWVLPSSGANSRGDVGGLMTAVGGTTNITTAAYLSDNYADWSPVEFKGMSGSSDAPFGDCAATKEKRGEECLGDYYTSSRYTGCSNTFLASATVERTIMSGSVGRMGPSDQLAWFGREQDGCVDLQVSNVQAAAAGAQGGGTIGVSDTTWNTGGVSAVPTTTTYYLSRDDAVGGADPVIGTRTVGTLGAGSNSASGTITVTLPDTAFGTYVVIACADSADVIDEVSDTNNCSASDSFDVAWNMRPGMVNMQMWARELDSAAWKGVVGAITPGGRIRVTGTGRISPVVDPAGAQHPNLQSAPPVIPWDIFLTVDQRVSLTSKPVGKIPTGPLKPRVLDNGTMKQWVGSASGTAVLPKTMPAGRYWVSVCTPIPDDDPVPQRACSTAKTPIVIVQKAVRTQTAG